MKNIKLVPSIQRQSLVGIRGTVPVKWGNYCSLHDPDNDEKGLKLANCWAENIEVLERRYGELQFSLYEDETESVVLLNDKRVAKEFYIPEGECCLRGYAGYYPNCDKVKEDAIAIWNSLPDITAKVEMKEKTYPEGTACFKISDTLVGYSVPINCQPKKLNIKYNVENRNET